MTRIMVVDDELLICQLLMYQLSGAGYQVSAVQSGREALKHLLLEQPDLVLLDVMIGDISGWEVCRHIRACSSVPVIMLTAKDTDGDVVTGFNAGADDYITKPFSMVQLLARIEAILRRTHALRLQPPVMSGASSVGTMVPPRDIGTAYVADDEALPSGLSPSILSTVPAASYTNGTAALPGVTGSGTRPGVVHGGHTGMLRGRYGGTVPTSLPASDLPPFSIGRQFFEARQLRGLTLHQAEASCGVRWDFLQALEHEHFGYMPRAQLRQALKTYSTFLGLDLDELLDRAAPPVKRPWPVPLVMLGMILLILVVMLGFQLW